MWIFVYPGSWKLGNVWFLWSFVYSGSWKLDKTEAFDFSEVLCTLGSWKLDKTEAFDFCEFWCTRVMKIGQNWSVSILWSLVYPRSWKLEKIETFDLVMKIGENWSIWFGHENWTKLKLLIFVNFCVTRVIKIGEN
mgnify:CR=1 FL=1